MLAFFKPTSLSAFISPTCGGGSGVLYRCCFNRILKPDGKLIVTTPNFSSLRSRFSFFFVEFEKVPATLLRPAGEHKAGRESD